MISPHPQSHHRKNNTSVQLNKSAPSHLKRYTKDIHGDSLSDSSRDHSSSSSTSSSSLSSSSSSSTKEERLEETSIRNQEDMAQLSLNDDLKSSCDKSGYIFQKISCYSTHHPGWSMTIALASVCCILYYVFVFRRRNSAATRRWRPWVPHGSSLGDSRKGEYAAVMAYDELLDEFDKEDLSSCDGSNSECSFDGDQDDEETQGPKQNKRNASTTRRRGIEMIPFDDGRLNLREING
jgi:hypothetical protein